MWVTIITKLLTKIRKKSRCILSVKIESIVARARNTEIDLAHFAISYELSDFIFSIGFLIFKVIYNIFFL